MDSNENNKKEMTPEDKLMEAIFSDKAVETNGEEFNKTVESLGHKVNDDYLLFIHALEREKELEPMVERIMKGKYFPNENYRNVFRWSIMQAAQWQYEQLKNDGK